MKFSERGPLRLVGADLGLARDSRSSERRPLMSAGAARKKLSIN